MKSDCKDCIAPKRHPGCHSTCPEYLKAKEEWEELKKVMARERDKYVSHKNY